MQDIDLPPHQWKSDRPKPNEPIFGSGLPYGLSVIVGIATAAYFADGTAFTAIASGIAAAIASFLSFEISAALKR